MKQNENVVKLDIYHKLEGTKKKYFIFPFRKHSVFEIADLASLCRKTKFDQ